MTQERWKECIEEPDTTGIITWNLPFAVFMRVSAGVKSTFFNFGLIPTIFWKTLFLLSKIDFW